MKSSTQLSPRVRRRRVTVAKDVIKQVQAKRYLARQGRYIDLLLALGDASPDVQSMVKKARRCQVCALGGLFASYAKVYDGIALAEGPQAVYESNSVVLKAEPGERVVSPCFGVSPTADLIRSGPLGELFGTEQLALVEAAFEAVEADGSGTRSRHELSEIAGGRIEEPLYRRVVRFAKRYKTPASRMIGIMRNIVKNGGVFAP